MSVSNEILSVSICGCVRVFLQSSLGACSHTYVCVCVCVCVCQVCVNRDERHRVRAWPCIIHEADLAEESRGSSALL